MRRHVGHSIFTSIQRCRQPEWKKWLHGVTILAAGRPASTGVMQITHSTISAPLSTSPGSPLPLYVGRRHAPGGKGRGMGEGVSATAGRIDVTLQHEMR